MALSPDDPDAHYFLACYLSTLGEAEDALESLASAIELDESCREDAYDETWLEPLYADARFKETTGLK